MQWFVRALGLMLSAAPLCAQVQLSPLDYVAAGPWQPSSDVTIDTTALTISEPGQVAILGVPSPDNRAVFCFDSIVLPAGIRVDIVGDRPLSLLSRRDLIIEAELYSAGEAGSLSGEGGRGGAGGFAGGTGPVAGLGPAGGLPSSAGGGGGGGSLDAAGGSGGSPAGGLGGVASLDGVFRGGSGGGGTSGGGGGGGGGAIELAAACDLILGTNSIIDVSGGDAVGFGGAGGGGRLMINAPVVIRSGVLRVRGGDAGVGGTGSGGGGASGHLLLGSAQNSSGFSFEAGPGTGGAGAPGETSGADANPSVVLFLVFGTFRDCNFNGIHDACELNLGTASDLDGNGIPDECDGSRFCFGDGGVSAGCTPCPCGNDNPGTKGGCLNAAGASARLLGSGSARASNDSLRFELESATPNSFALLYSGSEGLPVNPANPCTGSNSGVSSTALNGLRCVGQNILRHGTRATDNLGQVGGFNPSGGTPGWGPPDGPAGGLMGQNGFVAGQSRAFQVIYRDPGSGACSTGQNSSQAIRVVFLP